MHGEGSLWRGEAVLDDSARGLFQVHRSAFLDPAVLSREHESIFSRCWIYVGHESEVAQPGDFVTRTVVGHPLIFLRDIDRETRVFFNTCPHQGSMVCRVPRGHANTLQCFFHGWTYDTKGQLVGGPSPDAYGGSFDFAAHSLSGPPRVETYRGFIFMNLDSLAEPLVDYLGETKSYIDLVVDASPNGMRITPGTHRYSTRANWKMLVMNSADGYHVATTHATYFQYLRDAGIDLSARRMGARIDLQQGHSAAEFRGGWGRPVAQWAPNFPVALKDEIDVSWQDLVSRYGEERATRIAKIDRNLYIFPNLVILDHSAVTIRTFYPVSPGFMEVTSWSLAPVGESVEMSSARLENYLTFWGPAGFATPDDIEALETAQRGFANSEVPWCDVSKGALREDDPDREKTSLDEMQLRAFWRRWQTSMRDTRPVVA